MFLFFADSRCSLVYDLPAAAGTPEGVATLGSSEGGARRGQVPASAGTQDTLGGKEWSEAERNLPERLPCRPGINGNRPEMGRKESKRGANKSVICYNSFVSRIDSYFFKSFSM